MMSPPGPGMVICPILANIGPDNTNEARTRLARSESISVLLISAAGVTNMQGGATLFGVLYVADVENNDAYFESRGNNIVYGQVILDAEFGNYNGTFQVVYNENLLTRVAGTGGIGNVLGGWADFHPDSWQPLQ